MAACRLFGQKEVYLTVFIANLCGQNEEDLVGSIDAVVFSAGT